MSTASPVCLRVDNSLPCLASIYVCAGITEPCEVCGPHIEKWRQTTGMLDLGGVWHAPQMPESQVTLLKEKSDEFSYAHRAFELWEMVLNKVSNRKVGMTDLVDRLEELGVKEGYIDSTFESIQKFAFVRTDHLVADDVFLIDNRESLPFEKEDQSEKSDERLALLKTIRELMLAVEYMRHACEHAEGKSQREHKTLSRAMSVGSRINARYKHLLLDHQRESYWDEVWMMPSNVGLGPITDR